MMTTTTIKLLMIVDDDNYDQVIAAEGEQKSSKALKEASDIISTSPNALQLRLLLFFLPTPS